MLFWVAVACCAIAQLFIVRGALKPQRADVQDGVPRPRRASEVAWTIVPALVLATVLVMTWRAMHRDQAADRRGSSTGDAVAFRSE